MPRRSANEELDDYDKLPNYLKLNPVDRERLIVLHRFGFTLEGKVQAFDYLFPEKANITEEQSKVKFWTMSFVYKKAAKQAFIDKLNLQEVREANTSKDGELLKILELARKAEKKGDLKLCLECHKFISRLQGHVRDKQITNNTLILPAVEIHHNPMLEQSTKQPNVIEMGQLDYSILEENKKDEIPEKNNDVEIQVHTVEEEKKEDIFDENDFFGLNN